MITESPNKESWSEEKRKRTVRLAAWTSAWVVTMAIATFGPVVLWDSNLITVIAIAVNLLVGVGMIFANRDHLASLDELEQRLQLEAMGVTLGVGLIVGLAYSNLDTTDVIPFHAEISHLVIVMSLTYMSALLLLKRKYR